MKMTDSEIKTLREMGQTRSLYRWRPKSCEKLVEKGLAQIETRIYQGRPLTGYVITDEGRRALAQEVKP
jgi:DNA-binding PadR family transcriptional regulator